jgi:hypothetical protein
VRSDLWVSKAMSAAGVYYCVFPHAAGPTSSFNYSYEKVSSLVLSADATDILRSRLDPLILMAQYLEMAGVFLAACLSNDKTFRPTK